MRAGKLGLTLTPPLLWIVLGLAGACSSSSRSSHGGAGGTSGAASGAGGAGGSLSGASGNGGKGANGGQAGRSGGGTAGAGAGKAGAGGSGAGGGAGAGTSGAGGLNGAGRAAAGEGGETSGSGGSGGAPEAGPLGPIVDAFCETAKTCCEAASMPIGALEECDAAFYGTFDVDELFARGTVAVDEDALSECVAAYATARSSCEWAPVYAACHGVIRGLLADGESCTDPFECDRTSGPKFCLMLGSSSNPDVGTCMTPERAVADAPCLTTCELGAECSQGVSVPDESDPTALCYEADGLYCRFGYGCQPLVADGESCETFDACGSDGTCSSTCESLKGVGDSCVAIFECATHLTCKDSECAPEPVASTYTCSGQPPFFD